MDRLYDIKYDNKTWDIEDINGYGYDFTDKNTGESYSLYGNILGVEQIGENSFILLKKVKKDKYQFLRLKLENSVCTKEYEKQFAVFKFISEDKIIFDNDVVYSIINNAEDINFNWLRYKNIEISDIKGKNLGIEIRIPSMHESEYIFFAANVENFEPVSDAFSTLRNQIVPITEEYTIDDLLNEDIKYKSIIDSYTFNLYNSTREAGKEKILSKI